MPLSACLFDLEREFDVLVFNINDQALMSATCLQVVFICLISFNSTSIHLFLGEVNKRKNSS